MKTLLLVGLGNPETKYKDTRHNIGFEVLKAFVNSKHDIFALQKDIYFDDIRNLEKDKRTIFTGKTGSLFKRTKILALFPLSYMNSSGNAVQEIASFYKVNPEDIVVIHDDKDMEFGKVRIVEPARESGSGGHNGVQSIIEKLGTRKFRRLKIGVANELVRSGRADTSEFVLGKFTPEEQEQLPSIIHQALRAL